MIKAILLAAGQSKRLKSEKEIPDSFRLGEDNPFENVDDGIEFDMGMPDDSDDEVKGDVEEEEESDDDINLDDI